MLKDDIVRLRHMLDAATEAENFIKDKNRSDLGNDRKLWFFCLEQRINAYSASKPIGRPFHGRL